MANRSTSLADNKLAVEYSNQRGLLFLNIERGIHIDNSTLEWLKANIDIVYTHAVLQTQRVFILSDKFYMRTLWVDDVFLVGIYKKDKLPYYLTIDELTKLKNFLCF